MYFISISELNQGLPTFDVDMDLAATQGRGAGKAVKHIAVKKYDPSIALRTCLAIKGGDPKKVFDLVYQRLSKMNGSKPDVNKFGWKLSFDVYEDDDSPTDT